MFKGWALILLLVDVLFLMLVAATAAVLYWVYPEALERAYTGLGYGWFPVGLWCAAFLVALRFRTRWLYRYGNMWLAAAAAVALAVGVLTYFDAGYGPLALYGMGGRWGSAIMGPSAILGVLKLAALALVIPLLAMPRRSGKAYWVAVSRTGVFMWVALAACAVALARAAAWGGRLVASCFRGGSHAGGSEPTGFFSRLLRVFTGRSSGREQASAAVAAAEPTPPPAPAPPLISAKGSQWQLPPLELLAPADVHTSDEKPLRKMAQDIEEALADHSVRVEVADIKSGPRIVRFGIQPGWSEKKGAAKDGSEPGKGNRVRVQDILSREKDLSLAISAPSLRFEQVPGEALLGLEVPTPTPSKVTMREVMDSQDFRKFASKGGLPIALGADAGGASVAMDLAGLPHMMIAGATGSGKSVCINSIVASMLMTKPPDQLRMLMVDPKQVELTPFNGIPHLVLPVITEVDDVSPMLRGLIREMTHRYKLMADIGTRNISGYNAKSKEQMPYLVLIVDELADLMLVGGFEIEQSLVRLAQLGRAAGIHLVLATQRPSVKVVTGLLKANVPCRVAFAVASQVDARVILDSVGAEKLLGKGDMLLLNNDSPKPRRVQGTLVLDDETEKLVDFWQEQKGPPLAPINLEDDGEDGDEGDGVDYALLDKARELALRNPQLSSSLLERRLKIGGKKAEQILEVLEEEGLVIPA